jgi:hypothetical protein
MNVAESFLFALPAALYTWHKEQSKKEERTRQQKELRFP